MKQLRLDNEQLAAFCGALQQMYHAGIGFADALALLAEDEEEAAEKALLSAMSQKADEGMPFAEILRQSGVFPAYMCNLMLVGEKLGRSEETLKALAVFYEGRARLAHQLKNTLIYPSVLLLVLLAVVFILLVWVLPLFNDVYARLGGSLTGVAGGLLSLGMLLRRLIPVLAILLALAAGFILLLAISSQIREKMLSLWYKVHGDKGINRKINIARFAQALAMGLRSGLNAAESVELAAKLSEGSEGFRLCCTHCLDSLNAGSSLSAALRESGIFSKAQCRLLEAGIRGGSGEQAMEQIAVKALEESEYELESLAGRIEPAVVLIMSVLVGAILLSVMLPLMHIMTAIG